MSSAAPPPAAAAPAVPTAGAPAPAAPAPATTKKKTGTKKRAAGTATDRKPRQPAKKRKKPAAASGRAASAAALSSPEQILENAVRAASELAARRAREAAQKSDPLWYRLSDVFEATSAAGGRAPSALAPVEQMRIVESALAKAGLTVAGITPQAAACLLEQTRRVAADLTSHATDYAYAAGRPEIAAADLRLAADLRHEPHSALSTQLPKLNLVATSVNKQPLPGYPTDCYSGIVLPPAPHQLTARTYDVITGQHVTAKQTLSVQETPASRKEKKQQDASKKKSPGYGAKKGTQIPIKLKQGGGGSQKKDSPPQPVVPMDVDDDKPTVPPTAAAASTAVAGHQAPSTMGALGVPVPLAPRPP
jgi:histone H3/H4